MKNQYFAMAPTSEIAHEIKAKYDEHVQWLNSTGYGSVMQRLYDAYYDFREGGFGLYIDKNRTNAKLNVNHYKSLLQRIHGLVTNAKLSYVPRPINSDARSQVQADFAKGLLEYYSDEKNIDEYTSELVERAIVLLEAFCYAPWDSTQGIEITKSETGQNIMTGDQAFHNLTAYDVAYHHSQKKSPYFIVRVAVNKYDLAAEYPAHAEEITSMSDVKSQADVDRIISPFENDETVNDDQVYKYVLYHSRTRAMPKGRETEIVGDIVLRDSALRYKTIPVVRLTCSDMLETVGGDSPATSLLGLQEASDKLWSAVSINNLTNAKQNIHSTTDIDPQPLSDGMTLWVGPQAPTPLQLTQSSPETYKLIESYQLQQETISGVNKTARGNPDSAVGTAAGQALMLAQAVEFSQDLQRQYARAAGDLATIVIHNLQKFATEPRIAYIGGQSRSAYVKEFKADDIADVDRVTVTIGNPMTQTISGRYTLATEWVERGIVKDPAKLTEFLRTGQIDSLTEDQFKDSILIRNENEELRKGLLPIVSIMDIHPQHILEHKALASDPAFRYNAELMAKLDEHILDHIAKAKSMDPDLAAILGMPPLPSQQMPPPGSEDLKVGGVNPPNLPPETPEATQDAYQEYLGQIPPIGPDKQ